MYLQKSTYTYVNTRKYHGAYGAKAPSMDLVVECIYTDSDAERILLLRGVCRQLPVHVWKLEYRLNANKNVPLHFTAEVHVAVYSAWLQPDTPHSYSSVSRCLEVAALVQ